MMGFSTFSQWRRLIARLALPICLSAIVITAHYEFPVHRAAQYDIGETRFGSRSSHVNLPGAIADSPPSHSIRLLQPCIDTDQVDLSSDASATLVLLPKDPSPRQISCLKSMEMSLLSSEWTSPIYFAFEDSETKTIVKHIADQSHGRYQFTVSTSEAQPVPSPRFTNLQGWLQGQSDSAQDVIAIVAGWDSFSAIPGLTQGSASPVAAILELARIFRGLKNSEGLGKYSLLFLITDASALNGLGSRTFLSSVDARVLENLQLVICLDSLSSDELYLHTTPGSAQSEAVSRFQRAFLTSAQQFGVTGHAVSQEVIASDDAHAQFEHCHFSKEHLVAVTISGRPTLLEHRFRISSMFDEKESSEKVVRSIQMIAEALARFVFDVDAVALEEGSQSVNVDSVSHWMKYFHSQPTISATLPKSASIVEDLRQELESHLEQIDSKIFSPEQGSYRFFTESPKRMSAFQVKAILFDIGLVSAVSAYLAAFYFTSKVFVL